MSRFIDKLVCPICRGKLEIAQSFSCLKCARAFRSDPFPIFFDYATAPDRLKAQVEAYTRVAEALTRSGAAPISSFLNYGYVANQNRRHAQMEPPPNAWNRNSVRLLYEVIGQIPLEGKHILEIGCGRGGNISKVADTFSPEVAVGMDLCQASISHCHQVHARNNLWFCVADAQRLPFSDAAFEIILNIESSHAYPDIQEFFREVRRVLAPEGYFLYSDLQSRNLIPARKRLLEDLGFRLLRDEDISENVLASCDQIAHLRKQAYEGENRGSVLDEFLAAPGSGVYELLKRRETAYFSMAFQKN